MAHKRFSRVEGSAAWGHPADSGMLPGNRYTPFHRPVPSPTGNCPPEVGDAATDDCNKSSNSWDEKTAYDKGGSLGGYGRMSEGNMIDAGQNSSPRIASFRSLNFGQATAGSQQWTLHENPLDLLGIPRSAVPQYYPKYAAIQTTSASANSNTGPPGGGGPHAERSSTGLSGYLQPVQPQLAPF